MSYSINKYLVLWLHMYMLLNINKRKTKRKEKGLPHAHFLIILKRDWKIIAPESFDDIVLAELPNRYENSHPVLINCCKAHDAWSLWYT